MKTLKTKISILAVALLTILGSCSKDDAPTIPPIIVAPEQRPLFGYLAASGFNQTTTSFVNSNDLEVGYSFIPLTNGKITAIIARIPDVRGSLRATIFDKATGGILRTEILNSAAAEIEVVKTIAPLDLIQGKEYVISINSNDFFVHKRTDNADVSYPFTIGDIKITALLADLGTNQVMPAPANLDRYVGDVDFKFQK
jgi:hypothetical protein